MAQAAFPICKQIVEAGGDGTVRIGLVPSVSSLLFPLLPQTLAEAPSRLRIEFHDQTNDALIQALQRGEIDFGIGAIDSSLPAELLVYPLREDPFVAVLHRDDPLAAQAHLPWKQLVGRDIAVFSKGNIKRLVAALVESHRLTLTTRYQVDYIETPVWSGALSRLAVAILPALYTTHLQDPALRGRPAAAAGARPHSGPDARPRRRCPRLLKTVFPCCRPPCARGRCLISTSTVKWLMYSSECEGEDAQQPVMVPGNN